MAKAAVNDMLNLSEEDELFITCTICLEFFDEFEKVPKFLACHHSFCASCIEGMVNKKQSCVECPLCRRKTILNGADGVDKLTTNQYTLNCGNFARKFREGLGAAGTILWCVKCGTSARKDCVNNHFTSEIHAKDQATMQKHHDNMAKCRENWMGAALKRRELNSVLESVSSSLNVIRDYIDKTIDENSSQLAITESLIDNIEQFGSNPNDNLDFTHYLQQFKDAAEQSAAALQEATNGIAKFEHLSDWTVEVSRKHPQEAEPAIVLPLNISFSSPDPNARLAALAIMRMIPGTLTQEANKAAQCTQQQTGAVAREDTWSGTFKPAPTKNKAKKQVNNYASAVAINGRDDKNTVAIPTKPNYRNGTFCFMDVEVNGETLGRIVIHLRFDYAHLMCKYFLWGCKGKNVNYRGTRLFDTAKDLYVAGGKNDETGLEELYVPDKSTLKDERGAVRMRRRDKEGKVLVGTEFHIIVSTGPHMTYPITTVFGHIVEGLELCDQISALNARRNMITVANCGTV